MNELEARLRELRLRAPSPDLDRLVLSQRPEPQPEQPRAWFRVPLWAACAVALVAALAGFSAGNAWRANRAFSVAHPSPPITVRVLYHAPALGDPFDFTRRFDIFPAGEMRANIHVEKGI